MCVLPRAFILQLPIPICSIRQGSGPVLRCVICLPIREARLNGVGGEVLWVGLVRPIHRRVHLVDLDIVAALCILIHTYDVMY